MQHHQVRTLFAETVNQLSIDYPNLLKWDFGFDNAKRRAGVCRLREKKIAISVNHIAHNPIETIRDTLLHEIAHAIAFELYGDDGHGKHWRKIASRIGAKPASLGRFEIPDSPWMLVCFCEKNRLVETVAPRFRRNKQIKRYALKGRPETQGRLSYLKTEELAQFKSGRIDFEQLNFFQ